MSGVPLFSCCLALNGQTAFALYRRLKLGPGARVLVLSANSNLSLFILQILATAGIETWTATSRNAARCSEIVLRLSAGIVRESDVVRMLTSSLYFDAIVDPFFDSNFPRYGMLLRKGGSYATCGFGGGYSLRHEANQSFPNSIRIVFQCLGETADLELALRERAAGRWTVPVYAHFSDGGEAAFLSATFDSTDRKGKVAFVYDERN